MLSKCIFVVSPKANKEYPVPLVFDATLVAIVFSLDDLGDWRSRARGRTAIGTYLTNGLTRHDLATDHPELYATLANAMRSTYSTFVTVGSAIDGA